MNSHPRKKAHRHVKLFMESDTQLSEGSQCLRQLMTLHQGVALCDAACKMYGLLTFSRRIRPSAKHGVRPARVPFTIGIPWAHWGMRPRVLRIKDEGYGRKHLSISAYHIVSRGNTVDFHRYTRSIPLLMVRDFLSK